VGSKPISHATGFITYKPIDEQFVRLEAGHRAVVLCSQQKYILSPIPTRFEVFTVGTIKNAVFWDIKTQFVPHKKYITPPLQGPVG
jgi:hypothetical protein